MGLAITHQRSLQPPSEFSTSLGHVWRVEDGGDDADARRPGRQNLAEFFQVDATNGEPRDGHVRRRPADVVQRHGLGRRFGAGGKHRPDGDVIRSGVARAANLPVLPAGSASGKNPANFRQVNRVIGLAVAVGVTTFMIGRIFWLLKHVS